MVQPPYGGPPPYPSMPSGEPQGPHPYYQRLAPKPGCIPLRPLGLNDILAGTYQAIRRNPKLVFGLAAVVAIVSAVVTTAVQQSAFGDIGDVVDDSNPDHPIVHWGNLGQTMGSAFATTALSVLFAAVLTGMLIVVITEDVVGRRPELAFVWGKVRSRLGRLVALALIVGLAPVVCIGFAIVPGVWLWTVWSVAVPVLVIENTRLSGALGRSRELVRGMFWRVLGIRAVGYLISIVVAAVISAVFIAIAGGLTGISGDDGFDLSGTGSVSTGFLIITVIGSALASTITAPIQAGVDSLLYVDLRMRKENLAVELQQAAAIVDSSP